MVSHSKNTLLADVSKSQFHRPDDAFGAALVTDGWMIQKDEYKFWIGKCYKKTGQVCDVITTFFWGKNIR